MAIVVKQQFPRWPFELDVDKLVESVLLVAGELKGATLHSVSKALFLADKLHLSRYGRPVTGDRYVAMKYGPVPSFAYDILKTAKGDAKMALPPRAVDALAVENYSVRALRAPDASVLSESETGCLREAINEISGKSFAQRTNDSHGPAWESAGENDLIEIEGLLLEIDNRDELRAHLAHESS